MPFGRKYLGIASSPLMTFFRELRRKSDRDAALVKSEDFLTAAATVRSHHTHKRHLFLLTERHSVLSAGERHLWLEFSRAPVLTFPAGRELFSTVGSYEMMGRP